MDLENTPVNGFHHKLLLELNSDFPVLFNTERKKWSRNGSRVELFSCPQDGPHLDTVLVPLCKVAPLWSRFGKQYHFGQTYRFFFSNMIIKEKNGSTFKKWSCFPKQFQGEAILAPLFFSVKMNWKK